MRRACAVALILLGCGASLVAISPARAAEQECPHRANVRVDGTRRHHPSAGCDDVLGNTEIEVLDPSRPQAATSRNAFGVQTGSDLAIWAGAFVALALLVASISIDRRGRA